MHPDRHWRPTLLLKPTPAVTLLLALLTIGVIGLSGCGYRVVGHTNSLPPNIQTIAVEAFANHTANYRIEQRLTEAVVHELLARTKYRIVTRPEDADAVLEGDVTNIESSALVFDSATGRATTILVTANLKASLKDRVSGDVLYSNDNFVFREPYEVSTDISVFFQQEGPTLDRLSRDFASQLVSNILEKF